MSATHTFATICTRLNRAPIYVRGLQRRFGLPILADAPTSTRPSNCPTVPPPSAYSDAYIAFLETIIHLRVLGILEETILRLWTLERKLMQLLHADSTGSPTWFLDACGSTGNRDHRLLLSNFDIGAYLPSGTIQLGLNFAKIKDTPELFSAPEMGEDAILVLRQYQSLNQEIIAAIHAESPILRAALNHFPPARQHPPKNNQPRHRQKPVGGTLIPGEI